MSVIIHELDDEKDEPHVQPRGRLNVKSGSKFMQLKRIGAKYQEVEIGRSSIQQR